MWNMFPYFAKETTSWEGHLSGAVAGTVAALLFRNKGPQKPDPFAGETEEEEEAENTERAETAKENGKTEGQENS